VKEVTAGLPWWVKFVAIPAIVLVVFGGMILSIVGFLIGLMFKVLLVGVLVAGLVFVVRKFLTSSSSKSDW
jgi:hypothetical protein